MFLYVVRKCLPDFLVMVIPFTIEDFPSIIISNTPHLLFLHLVTPCVVFILSVEVLYSHLRNSMNERTHFFIKKYISHTLFSKGLMLVVL